MPAERALATAFRWTVAGALVALPALAIDISGHVVAISTWHLIALVIFEVALALTLAPVADEAGWFSNVAEPARSVAAAASVVALVTGAAALVTMATSAALRFDPSMQFLQLLSALDIAWVVAAAAIGARRRWGSAAATGAAIAIGVFCVWSIWRYLDTVGVGPLGEWVVDGSELMRLVLPNDMIAAVVAVSLLVIGTRHRTAHPRAQS
ncbi:MAG: hypothetical protein OES13_11540 [Acidimicrobiia bacterium]|nr:hypothetical protein [Acidimicrobiia bacterium]